jgi:hypothetical protein
MPLLLEERENTPVLLELLNFLAMMENTSPTCSAFAMSVPKLIEETMLDVCV